MYTPRIKRDVQNELGRYALGDGGGIGVALHRFQEASTSICVFSSFFSSSRSTLLLFIPLGHVGKSGIADLTGHMFLLALFMVDIRTADNYTAVHFLPLISDFFLSC